MQTALVTSPLFSEGKILTGKQFESLVKNNPDILERATLHHPDNKLPLIFKSSYSKRGHIQKISAHFAYAAGYAPVEDHIFKPSRGYKNITEAVQGGAKILLSLNLDLSYLSLDFSAAADPLIKNENRWKAANRNYYSASVKTVEEAVQAIQKINALGVDLDNDVYALYRNAVLPYREFYLGKREADILKLYNDMEEQNSGVTIGQTRNINFPRLFRFTAAGTTIREEGVKGIKSEPIKKPLRGVYNHLFSSSAEVADKRIALQTAWDKTCEGNGEIYVMACPSITLGNNDSNQYLRQMRWIINDPEKQIIPIKNEVILEAAKTRFNSLRLPR